MDPRRERPWLSTMAGSLAWSLFVIALAYPIYIAVADENQGLVIRLAAAVILAIALVRFHNRLRADIDGQPPSQFDLPREQMPRAVKIDPQLAEWHSQLQHSLKSRNYFDHVLWPRLVALARRRGVIVKSPPLRWPAARGPSLGALGDLVSSLERKP
jgi:hypothetical protein